MQRSRKSVRGINVRKIYLDSAIGTSWRLRNEESWTAVALLAPACNRREDERSSLPLASRRSSSTCLAHASLSHSRPTPLISSALYLVSSPSLPAHSPARHDVPLQRGLRPRPDLPDRLARTPGQACAQRVRWAAECRWGAGRSLLCAETEWQQASSVRVSCGGREQWREEEDVHPRSDLPQHRDGWIPGRVDS